MLSYYYLYEARQRLDNAKKTIEMMGGEHSCQPMLLGQRDMIELEVEYYKGEADKFTLILLTLAAFCGIMVVMFMKGFIHVW